MNIFEFMNQSPWVTVFVSFFILVFLIALADYTFKLISVLKNGYPPKHCDALGDSTEEDKEEPEEDK